LRNFDNAVIFCSGSLIAKTASSSSLSSRFGVGFFAEDVAAGFGTDVFLAAFVPEAEVWLFGAVWYSPPVFAKPWMAMLGIQKGQSKRASLIAGMISSLIGDLVLSFILAHFIIWSDASTVGWGALIGFLVWCGFFAAPNLPQGIYEGRPFKLFAINNGYWLIGLLVSGGILAAWR